jgi:hypothetical protein
MIGYVEIVEVGEGKMGITDYPDPRQLHTGHLSSVTLRGFYELSGTRQDHPP